MNAKKQSRAGMKKTRFKPLIAGYRGECSHNGLRPLECTLESILGAYLGHIQDNKKPTIW